MSAIRIEWERHPQDKRPAHEAQWTCYMDGRIVGVWERPHERAYMPGSGLWRAFRPSIFSVTAMRYYISWYPDPS